MQANHDALVPALLLDKLVDLGNLLLQALEVQSRNGQHGSRDSLAILDASVGESGRESERREGEGSLETDLEENGQAVEGLLVEGLPGISLSRSGGVLLGDDAGRDDSLRVTGRSLELLAELLGSERGALAENDVLGELSETDERERDGAGSEVGDGRAERGGLEPLEGVEGGVVELGRLLGRSEVDEVLRGASEEGSEERRVEVEERLLGFRSEVRGAKVSFIAFRGSSIRSEEVKLT